MSIPSTEPLPPADGVTLTPRFWVPLGVAALGVAPLLLQPLLPVDRETALLIGLLPLVLGLFLAVQARLLRLRFTDDALLVLRRDNEIRRFPYDQWIAWRIFWTPLPVIFYFRETRTPHLVPMLFDANALRAELQQRLSLEPASSR